MLHSVFLRRAILKFDPLTVALDHAIDHFALLGREDLALSIALQELRFPIGDLKVRHVQHVQEGDPVCVGVAHVRSVVSDLAPHIFQDPCGISPKLPGEVSRNSCKIRSARRCRCSSLGLFEQPLSMRPAVSIASRLLRIRSQCCTNASASRLHSMISLCGLKVRLRVFMAHQIDTSFALRQKLSCLITRQELPSTDLITASSGTLSFSNIALTWLTVSGRGSIAIRSS